MQALDLARWQFAITTIYHFFFVPLTLGLVPIVAIMETNYVRTGDETYKRMAQFWGKLFLINFAIGVVTGIVQEFQFGMNWSTYSRFVGDIFGAPLAIEALLAFYLESTFLGIWVFGWDKLPKRVHLATIWLVTIGSWLSALWILIANSWMQNPVGFKIDPKTGRAQMTDFFAVIFNPHVLVQYPHVLTGALCTGAFFIVGISAWHLWKRRAVDLEMFRRSFQIGIVTALVSTVLVVLVGHTQAQEMVKAQPMKMAAAEALWNTEDPASMSIFTIGNEKSRSDVYAIRIPDLLSVLAFNNISGKVEGINQLQAEYTAKYGPGDYVPPVALVYWSFRLMVGSGVLMLLAALLGVFFVVRKDFEKHKWFLIGLIGVMVLPYIANSTGWLMTELGRQPWIVFGLLKTSDAVSPTVTAGNVIFSLVAFTLVYGVLMGVDLFLLARYAIGPVVPAENSDLNGQAGTGAETLIPELTEVY